MNVKIWPVLGTCELRMAKKKLGAPKIVFQFNHEVNSIVYTRVDERKSEAFYFQNMWCTNKKFD